MKMNRFSVFCLLLFTLLFSCKPTVVDDGTFYLNEGSKAWIVYEEGDTVRYTNQQQEYVFIAGPSDTYFETVLYDSDQSGFVGKQKDHYGDMERLEMVLNSTDNVLNIKYLLAKEKSAVTEWDMFHAYLYGELNYDILLKVAVNNDGFGEYGEQFKYHDTITIRDSLYHHVFYWEQIDRPKAIFVTKESGVVAFQFDSDSLFVLSMPD